MKKSKKKETIAWADVGSHGYPFYFEIGPIAEKYPGLLHIYKNKLTPNLKKVRIIIEN